MTIFNLSALTGSLTNEARKLAVNEGHHWAFDWDAPINNFLYKIGMHDPRRLIEMVDQGTVVQVDADIQSAAAEFLTKWIQLIHDVKVGQAHFVNTTFGRVTVDRYDREELVNDANRFNGFKKSIKTMCVLASMDFDAVLAKMLE